MPHRSTVRRGLLALLPALALALTPLAPASAESGAHQDGTSDLWFSDNGSDFEPFDGTTFNGDLRKVQAAHTRKKVVLTATYTDLRKHGSDTVFVIGRIATDEHKTRLTYTSLYQGTTNTRVLKDKKDGSRVVVDCGNIRTRARYGKDKVVTVIPRGCFSKPRWIRWELESYLKRDLAGGGAREIREDGHSNQAFFSGGFEPKLRRG